MAEKERETHLDTDDARAGATPHMTRHILSVSLVLVIIAFIAVIWAVYG